MTSRPSSLLALPSYASSRVAAITRAPLRRLLAEHDLQLPHFAVLSALDEEGPLAQRDLVERLGIDKSQIVKLVDYVEARGLARRSPAPGDRRRYQVAITPTGRRLVRDLGPRALAEQLSLLHPLTKAEKDTLLRLLRKVISHS